MHDAIKFGQGNANGNLHRIHALKAILPFLIGRHNRVRLQQRNIPLL